MGADPAHRPDTPVPASSGPSRELVLRVVSGLFMAAVAGALLIAGPVPFAVLVGTVAVLTSFEWSRIVRGEGIDAGLAAQAASVVMAAALAASGFAALGLAAVLGGAILTGLLCFGRRPLMSAEGVLYAGLPVVALIWLRQDEPHGLMAVLLIFIAVVATDVAAFVFGRLLGGPKLAPAVSPNKTWSGFLGGIAMAGLAAAAFGVLIGAEPWKLGMAGSVLGLLAQVGDLAESALKRSFGVKDSGAVIPGHGGIMDRVDGLVFAASAAAVFAFAIDPQSPARALLFGG
jgi:phosphatidate cytidylyltransferase